MFSSMSANPGERIEILNLVQGDPRKLQEDGFYSFKELPVIGTAQEKSLNARSNTESPAKLFRKDFIVVRGTKNDPLWGKM